MDINYDRLPEHMRGGARRYIERGIPPGNFMQAVIRNDLFDALGRADDINRHRLYDICCFFYNDAPSGCFGSLERLSTWMKQGGLSGPAAAA